MFYTAETLKQLRKAIDSLIEAVGEDAPVGVAYDGQFAEYCSLTWVVIDQEGNIVGTEADDDEVNLRPGQQNAIKIS